MAKADSAAGFNVDISLSTHQVKLQFDDGLNNALVTVECDKVNWQLLNTVGVVLLELSAKMQKNIISNNDKSS